MIASQELLDDLKYLRPNWAGTYSIPPNDQAIKDSKRFLTVLIHLKPELSISEAGVISLYWDNPYYDVTIDFDGAELYTIFILNKTNGEMKTREFNVSDIGALSILPVKYL